MFSLSVEKIKLSPSASNAVAVPITTWPSFLEIVELEVKIGGLSFKLRTFTVIFCVQTNSPSVAVTVPVKLVLDS